MRLPLTHTKQAPCTTWRQRFEGDEEKNSRSSASLRGSACSAATGTRPGCPSSGHAAIGAWNAASKGGTSCGKLVERHLVTSRKTPWGGLHIVHRPLAIVWCLLLCEFARKKKNPSRKR